VLSLYSYKDNFVGVKEERNIPISRKLAFIVELYPDN
jgi:hypothetical protein